VSQTISAGDGAHPHGDVDGPGRAANTLRLPTLYHRLTHSCARVSCAAHPQGLNGWRMHGPPPIRGIVQILHGLGEHSRRPAYLELATALVRPARFLSLIVFFRPRPRLRAAGGKAISPAFSHSRHRSLFCMI
jgi:hypothetical protein